MKSSVLFCWGWGWGWLERILVIDSFFIDGRHDRKKAADLQTGIFSADITCFMDFLRSQPFPQHGESLGTIWHPLHHPTNIQQLITASPDAVPSIVAAEFNILACYQTPINSETPPLFPFFSSQFLPCLLLWFRSRRLEALKPWSFSRCRSYNIFKSLSASPKSCPSHSVLSTGSVFSRRQPCRSAPCGVSANDISTIRNRVGLQRVQLISLQCRRWTRNYYMDFISSVDWRHTPHVQIITIFFQKFMFAETSFNRLSRAKEQCESPRFPHMSYRYILCHRLPLSTLVYRSLHSPATLQLYSNVKGTHESPG